MYLLIVDIDFRLTFGKNGELAVATFYAGQHRKQVVCCAHVFQYGVLHLNGHTASHRFVLRHAAFHLNSFHHITVALEPDDAHILLGAETIDGLVADEADADEDFVLLIGNDKLARLVADPTREKSGVSRIEDGNIGKGQRLALFVDEGSPQVALRLVGALHEILVAVPDNADGIEANDLHQRIVEAEAFEGAGDGEVFEVVIYE